MNADLANRDSDPPTVVIRVLVVVRNLCVSAFIGGFFLL